MTLADAEAMLRARGVAYGVDHSRHRFTLGVVSPERPGDYARVQVLEDPVFVIQADDGLWDVSRLYNRVGRMRVGSFRELDRALEFAIALVEAGPLADRNTDE
jgi:hypothetical protein